MTWKCNSCGAVYDDPRADGTPAFHVCPAEEILEYAGSDDKGNVNKPEKRQKREHIRNENIRPGLVYIEGKPMMREPDPAEPGRRRLVPADSIIVSEGAGRTELEPAEGEQQP